MTREGPQRHHGWRVDIALYLGGNWYCNSDIVLDVVAWAPLPMTYTAMSGQ